MWGKRTEEACFDKVLIKFSRSHRPLGVGLTDPSEPPHALAGVVTLSRARFQSERVRTLPALSFPAPSTPSSALWILVRYVPWHHMIPAGLSSLG